MTNKGWVDRKIEEMNALVEQTTQSLENFDGEAWGNQKNAQVSQWVADKVQHVAVEPKHSWLSKLRGKKDTVSVPALGSLADKQDAWWDAADGKVAGSYLSAQYPDFQGFILGSKRRFKDHLAQMTLAELAELSERQQLRQYFYDRGFIELEFIEPEKAVSNLIMWDEPTDYVFINADPRQRFFRRTIQSFEIIRDGETSERFGLGSAVGGVLLTGGIGALAGFMMPKKNQVVTDLRVRIITTGEKSLHDIYLIDDATKVKSAEYESAAYAVELITEFLQNYLVNQAADAAPTTSNLDELKKLAELRDQGIVTEAEFTVKKQQLLGL